MVKSLVVLSVSLPAAACFLFDHKTIPPRIAKRTTAIKSPLGFTALPPLPPGGEAHRHHAQREDDDAQPPQHADLLRVHVERPVFGSLRTDRDEVFIRSQPVDHVEE